MKDLKFVVLKKFSKTITAAAIGLFFQQLAYADALPPAVGAAIKSILPGSVEPGVISNTLSAPSIQPQQRQPSGVTRPEEKKGGLGPEAQKIKFTLNEVILEGNSTYTTQQLLPLYQKQLHKQISIADLEDIVQRITNFYRNNGYILSRAILPPQHVMNGVVHIRIIEGYISNAVVQGSPKRGRCIIQQYGNRIVIAKPTRIDTLEHYLRLMNEVPGMSARSVLEPSKTEIGASDMTIVANEQTINASLSYDNYGTRYIGPNQITGSISGNSIFQSGDSTQFTAVRTSRPEQLQYEDINHQFPIGCDGLRGTIGVNDSRTIPGLNLALLKISGDATNFYYNMSYPIIRARDQDLTLNGGLNYIDSGTNTFDFTLYNDHIRSANFGFNYDLTDTHGGANTISSHIEHGFLFAGASSDPTSPTVSRFGADGKYTKWTASAGRVQQIFWRFSTFVYGTGQLSWEPLLATEQFAFGGNQLGRGYDPAEIIGDNGVGGTVELRMDITPNIYVLQAMQAYMFYDGGVIWNKKDVPGVLMKQSITSAGFGIRFNFTKHVSGNLMIAQPLTKQVTAEEVIGQGRLPRSFFSIVLAE